MFSLKTSYFVSFQFLNGPFSSMHVGLSYMHMSLMSDIWECKIRSTCHQNKESLKLTCFTKWNVFVKMTVIDFLWCKVWKEVTTTVFKSYYKRIKYEVQWMRDWNYDNLLLRPTLLSQNGDCCCTGWLKKALYTRLVASDDSWLDFKISAWLDWFSVTRPIEICTVTRVTRLD